jgi:hypothetical protein
MKYVKHHPEQLSNEIFMGNCALSGPQTGWKTTRLGNFAYNTSGNVLNNSKPWFVKKKEVEKCLSELSDYQENDYPKEIYQSMIQCGRI